MVDHITPEEAGKVIFSPFTNAHLEDAIQNTLGEVAFLHQNVASFVKQGLREFFLYGFIRASDMAFETYSGESFIEETLEEQEKFATNNDILALADWDGALYIRGRDNYIGMSHSEPRAAEGSLLDLGYTKRVFRVPHSSGETYTDPKLEQLINAVYRFSKTSPSYDSRNPYLPRIQIGSLLLVPGNKERTISIELPDESPSSPLILH